MVSTLTKNDFDSTKNDFGSTKNDFDSTNNDFDSSLSLSETLTWTLQRFCRLTPLFWEALCQIWSRFMERCIAETMPELSNFVDVQIRPVEEVSSISTSTSRSHATYFTKSASKVIKTTKWAQDTKNGFDSNKKWFLTPYWDMRTIESLSVCGTLFCKNPTEMIHFDDSASNCCWIDKISIQNCQIRQMSLGNGAEMPWVIIIRYSSPHFELENQKSDLAESTNIVMHRVLSATNLKSSHKSYGMEIIMMSRYPAYVLGCACIRRRVLKRIWKSCEKYSEIIFCTSRNHFL